MSKKNSNSNDEAVKHLYKTIKHKLEEDGVLNDMRCKLHAKMVAMMNDNAEGGNCTLAMQKAGEVVSDVRMQTLHQLIMEYLHWHGFHYTAEMFAVETGAENKKPLRETLEGLLGTFPHRELPILLSLVVDLNEKHNAKQQKNHIGDTVS